MIKKYEDFRDKPYRCDAGVLTIGYGTTNAVSDIIGITIEKMKTPISKETAEVYLRKTVKARFAPAVNAYDNIYHWTQNEFDALTSFCYNMGGGKMKELTKNGTNSKSQIANDLLLYKKAGGKVLEGLVKRRKEEKALFES